MKKFVIVSLCIIFITGCNKNNNVSNVISDNYAKYNKNGYEEVNIDNDIIKDTSDSKIKKIIKEGTGVIFIGDASSNKSRVCMNVLLKIIDNTDLNVVYYNENIDNVKDYVSDTVNIPIILFVFGGKIESYHVGTISDKEKLNSDEKLELYNIYLDGVHKVLNDVCDERC